ncbi:hypothetical protein ACFLXO_04485 [Chloroflexota bacterium]
MTTEMNPKHLGPLSKYARKDFLKKVPRVTASLRNKILRTYERGLKEGRHGEELLERLGDEYGKSTRQIQRYIQQERNERTKAAGIRVSGAGHTSFIDEARKQHYEELHQLIQQWKEQLVHEVSVPHRTHIAAFPTAFGYSDVKANMGPFNHHTKGSLYWYFDKEGKVKVWFSVEDESMFRCLRPHLPNKKLWQLFEELKNRLAKGIMEAASTKEGKRIPVRDSLSLASEIADELEIALAKKVLSGKCEACPAD